MSRAAGTADSGAGGCRGGCGNGFAMRDTAEATAMVVGEPLRRRIGLHQWAA